MKSKLFLTTAILSALMFTTGCESNDPNNPWKNNNATELHSDAGMYVGITSFSDNVKYYGSQDSRYHSLTKSNSANYTSFINGLSMGDATVLYYAVDNNLSYLEKCQFPADLSSVNIITFTDGLNQGSRALDKQDGNHSYAADDKSYVAEINRKIHSIKVGGQSINAYAIGIRGKDVQGDAAKTFSDNLVQLSSNKDNAIEVANMDEVSAKFKEIAESLYKKSESRTLRITIPMPSENEKERFTFDDVTEATASKCYLEGVYAEGALTNIKYVGCMSTSGTKVEETSAGGVKIQFEFENFTDDKGNTISFNKMQQWHMEASQSTWTRNSEFKPSEAIVTTEERKTAVVMLILDCSSSLGSDFAKVKTAASDFIKTLAGEVTGGGDNPGGGGGSSKAKVRFRKEDAYIYVTEMSIEQVPGGGTGTFVTAASYTFGEEAGTTSYYEINAQVSYPVYYNAYYNEYQFALGDENPEYIFEGGKKYTYSCGDDGEYLVFTITLDGSFNAPAKVVAQKRILKSDMRSLSPVRR